MPTTLTDRVVHQAKARDARVETADAVVPDLYLMVRPAGAIVVGGALPRLAGAHAS